MMGASKHGENIGRYVANFSLAELGHKQKKQAPNSDLQTISKSHFTAQVAILNCSICFYLIMFKIIHLIYPFT